MPDNPYKSPEADTSFSRKGSTKLSRLRAGVYCFVAVMLLAFGAVLVQMGVIGGPAESPSVRAINVMIGLLTIAVSVAFAALGYKSGTRARN